MSTTTHEVEPVEPGGTMPASHVEAHGKQHPTDASYIKIALILGVLTALEVATYFVEDDVSRPLLLGGLFVMMAVKFWIVASFFMHLRFDNPLFKRLFYFGLILAIAVYAGILLTAMEFWSSVYER